MSFFEIYLQGLLLILALMTSLWIASLFTRNAGIVDPFWSLGFIMSASFYLLRSGDAETRKLIVLALVVTWGARLSFHLFRRNMGKGEDFRYREFRTRFGEHRYWWVSFFQVFLLQGFLMWLISAPLLGVMFHTGDSSLTLFDAAALLTWLVGFTFEAGGDRQLARFKSNPANKGKVLDTGFWKYTRHPNYFGDSAVWWGFGLFAIAAGSPVTALGSVLMTLLLVKVSGVAMLEKSLRDRKPEYREYIRKTSSFLPWFPKD